MLYIRSRTNFSQSRRDDFIVAQGFNPGNIAIDWTFKSHRDDIAKHKLTNQPQLHFLKIHFPILYIRSHANFSQSHRDGFIVAQGFNPGFIEIDSRSSPIGTALL